MHQIRFRLSSASDTSREAYSAPPEPLAGFQGPTSKGREGKEGRYIKGSLVIREGRGGRGGEGREGESRIGEGKEGKGGEGRGKDPWYLLSPLI